MRAIRIAFILGFLLILAGCTSIGPSRIRADRNAYNNIVRQTDYQQLLTNIVHLAYVEPTLYLRVTNITASYSLNEHLNGTANFNRYLDYNNHLLGLEPGVSYSDSPTISYVPVDDVKFVRMMYQPVSFGDITLLFNGGINDIKVLARLAFNRVGDLQNAPSAASPKMVDAPHYRAYYRFVKLLITTLHQQQAQIYPGLFHHQYALVLRFTKNNVYAKNVLALKKLLKVSRNSNYIIFLSRNFVTLKENKNAMLVPVDRNQGLHNIVYVETRSADSMLAFLSHSVQIPEAEFKAGIVPIAYDTQPLMHKLMKIQCSNTKPTNAFVSTYVNHHWFYIEDTDIDSKVTFTLLMRLMTLISGYDNPDNTQTAPLITVPVGAQK